MASELSRLCLLYYDRVTNLVKFYLMLGGNERYPNDDDAFGKVFRARHEVTRRKRDFIIC